MCLTIQEAHEGEVNALQFNAAGRMLASGGGDRKIKLWDVGQSKTLLINLLKAFTHLTFVSNLFR